MASMRLGVSAGAISLRSRWCSRPSAVDMDSTSTHGESHGTSPGSYIGTLLRRLRDTPGCVSSLRTTSPRVMDQTTTPSGSSTATAGADSRNLSSCAYMHLPPPLSICSVGAVENGIMSVLQKVSGGDGLDDGQRA